MKIDLFNIMAFIVLILSIIAWICKIDMGQSFLLPIWVVIAMIAYNEKN